MRITIVSFFDEQLSGRRSGTIGQLERAHISQVITEPRELAQVVQVIQVGDRIERHAVIQAQIVGDRNLVLDRNGHRSQSGRAIRLPGQFGQAGSRGQEDLLHGDCDFRSTALAAIACAETGGGVAPTGAVAEIATDLKLIASQDRGGERESRAEIGLGGLAAE